MDPMSEEITNFKNEDDILTLVDMATKNQITSMATLKFETNSESMKSSDNWTFYERAKNVRSICDNHFGEYLLHYELNF